MKIKIEIPQTLKDVHLDTFIQFAKIDTKDEQELKHRAFSLLLGLNIDTIKSLDFKHTDILINELNTLLSDKPKQQLTFEIDGVKYGRIPNMENLSFGEYYDLDGYITPLFEGEVKHEEAFKFMSVMYRPIVDEVKGLYSIKPYTGNEDWHVMKKAPTNAYLDTVGFFLNLNKELSMALRTYLQGEATQIAHEQSLEELGDGMGALTTLLEATSLSTYRLQSYRFCKSLQNCYSISKMLN